MAASEEDQFRPDREQQLRHHAKAVDDMIRQLKGATQSQPESNFGKRNRGNSNKGHSQKYRGKRSRNQPRAHSFQRQSYDQWEEIPEDGPYYSMEGYPSHSGYSSHRSDHITPQCLVQSLLDFPNFSASLLQLMELKNLNPSSVRFVASIHQQVFLLSGEKVTLKPKIAVCREYLANEGCQNRSACRNFHICPNYIAGTCDVTNCFIGHSWHTDHNGSILESFFIEQLPVEKIHDLFQSLGRDRRSQGLLDVCLQYNKDGCQQSKCKALHVCLNFVVGFTKCNRKSCQLNHNILDQSCSHLLEVHGFSTNETPRDVVIALLAANPSLAGNDKIPVVKQQKDYLSQVFSKEGTGTDKTDIEVDGTETVKDTQEDRLKEIETDLKSSKEKLSSDNESESDGNEEENEGSSGSDDSSQTISIKNKSSLIERKKNIPEKNDAKDTPPKLEPRRTLWSHYLQGDVSIQEICYDSVERVCKYEASGCQRLHATRHFHWQVSEQGKRWLNLRSAQVTCLERAFCDVAKDGIDLPRLDPATIEYAVSGLLILLGRDTWHADFKAMNLTNSTDTKRLLIRRLHTEAVQGQVIKAAMFMWSFLDKNQKWVKYGNIDTAGESNLVSSVTSDDIERHYLQNPSTPLIFKNSQFNYVLDFKTMVQTNQKTQVSREVRRRPELHLEEDHEPEEKKASEFPVTWDVMQPEERMRLVPVVSSSKEYQTVINLLGGKLSSSSVTKIERVQNPFLWRAIQNKITEMTAVYADASKVDVRQLFHGTSHDVVSSICVENFDWRLHGSSSGQMYGRGTYFSTDAKYSYNYCRPDAAGKKYMFVARVALGAITAGSSSMSRPPINPATNAPFDSTVDNISNFSILVKYDKQEYYPEYILTLT